jgi:hypothetical protein
LPITGIGGSGTRLAPVSWHQARLLRAASKINKLAPLAHRHFIFYSLRSSFHRFAARRPSHVLRMGCRLLKTAAPQDEVARVRGLGFSDEFRIQKAEFRKRRVRHTFLHSAFCILSSALLLNPEP